MEDRGCFNLSGLTVHQKTGALLLEGVEPLIESQEDAMDAPDEGPFSPHDHLDLHLSLSPQSEANIGGAPMDHGDPQEGFTPMAAAEDAYAGQAAAAEDPYAPLDPTEACQWNPKPFRRGNPQMKLASEEEDEEEDQETWFAIPKTSEFAQQAR